MFVIYGVYQLLKSGKLDGGRICEACGNWSDVGSYTSWEFLHLYFVPIIPLRRLRFVNHCFLCNRVRKLEPGEAARLAMGEMESARQAAAGGDMPGAVGHALAGAQLGGIEPAREFLDQQSGMNLDVLKARGQLALWRGQWSAAEAIFEQAIQMSSSDAAAHFCLGQVLLALRREEQGIAEMRTAAGLAPKAVDVRLALMREANRRVRWRDWLAVAQEYVALVPPASLKPDFLHRLELVRNRIAKEDEQQPALDSRRMDSRLDELDPPNPYAQR